MSQKQKEHPLFQQTWKHRLFGASQFDYLSELPIETVAERVRQLQGKIGDREYLVTLQVVSNEQLEFIVRMYSWHHIDGRGVHPKAIIEGLVTERGINTVSVSGVVHERLPIMPGKIVSFIIISVYLGGYIWVAIINDPIGRVIITAGDLFFVGMGLCLLAATFLPAVNHNKNREQLLNRLRTYITQKQKIGG